jgi:hypothetical protein
MFSRFPRQQAKKKASIPGQPSSPNIGSKENSLKKITGNPYIGGEKTRFPCKCVFKRTQFLNVLVGHPMFM